MVEDHENNDTEEVKPPYIDGGSVLDDDEGDPSLEDTNIHAAQSNVVEELNALLLGAIPVNVRRLKYYFQGLAAASDATAHEQKNFGIIHQWLKDLDQGLEGEKIQALEFVTAYLRDQLGERSAERQRTLLPMLSSTLGNFLAKTIAIKKSPGKNILELQEEIEAEEDTLLPYLINNL